jgi:hypothetical protein
MNTPSEESRSAQKKLRKSLKKECSLDKYKDLDGACEWFQMRKQEIEQS